MKNKSENEVRGLIGASKLKKFLYVCAVIAVASGVWHIKPWVGEQNVKPLYFYMNERKMDDGVEKALNSGYPTLDDININNSGNKLNMYDIVAEEDCVHFKLSAILNKTALESFVFTPFGIQKTEDSKITSTLSYPTNDDLKIVLKASIKQKDSLQYEEIPVKYTLFDTNKNIYSADIFLLDSHIAEILNESADLYVHAVCMLNDNVIFDFPPEALKIKSENIYKSDSVLINQEIPTSYGSIIIDELKISPATMTLKTRSALEKGYFLSNFEKLELTDSSGKVYVCAGKYRYPNSKEGRTDFYFNSSTFYNHSSPDKYTLTFSDISLNDNGEDVLTLAMEGRYPIKTEYMNEKVFFYKPVYIANTLTVPILYDDYKIKPEFYIYGVETQEIVLPTHIITVSTDKTENKYLKRKENISKGYIKASTPKKSEYRLKIPHPDFYLHKSGTLEILCNTTDD